MTLRFAKLRNWEDDGAFEESGYRKRVHESVWAGYKM